MQCNSLQSRGRAIVDHRTTRRTNYAKQRSILKNSQEHNIEEAEILEAKKQLILRRRRLFSHYRQYEQWRRRQFSYDPCYFRANHLPLIGQTSCADYYSNMGIGSAGAFRRRRQYRRQYSCANRSHDGSRDSRETAAYFQKCHSMVNSETLRTDPTSLPNRLGHSNYHQYEHVSFDSSDLHRYNSRNFHMLHEERSTSISERCTRNRINSAIFVSAEGRGFDSIEFLRRHGSQSVLCRKTKSAENITDNDRKKNFCDQRQWRTDEEPEYRALHTNQQTLGPGDFELMECRGGGGAEGRVVSVLNSNAEMTTAVTTAGNVIVGSISIEAPPSNIFDDTNSVKSMRASKAHSSITTSASHDSADTVEELVQITATTKNSTDTTPAITKTRSPSPVLPSTLSSSSRQLGWRKSRVLVRQRSSTTSPIGFRSQSPASAVFAHPKPLTLKSVKPKIINNLPMVSISGPSPQDEKPECL